MSRTLLAILIGVASGLAFLAVSGCEEKTVTVQQSEQRTESEPQMTSPGEMVVE